MSGEEEVSEQVSGKFDVWAVKVSQFLAQVGLIGLACQAFLVLLDVVFRWILNMPLRGMEDAVQLLVAVSLAAFFPVAMAQRENVSIGALGRLVGPRAKLALELLGAAGMMLMTSLIAWQLTRYAWELYVAGERTIVLGLPMTPFWVLVVLLSWFTASVQGLVLLSVATIKTKNGVH